MSHNLERLHELEEEVADSNVRSPWLPRYLPDPEQFSRRAVGWLVPPRSMLDSLVHISAFSIGIGYAAACSVQLITDIFLPNLNSRSWAKQRPVRISAAAAHNPALAAAL